MQLGAMLCAGWSGAGFEGLGIYSRDILGFIGIIEKWKLLKAVKVVGVVFLRCRVPG